jgi:hypothetical protein
VASLYKKMISGKPYWYLREMGWVDGKPKMVSERYLGTAADIGALLDAREQAMLPERTRHLDFGAVAAAWGLLADLGVAAIIDEETGARPPGLPLSPGTYLALAALNRVVDPCSKRAFADWWRTTAADRFTRIPASALDHRRFWDAFHAVPPDALLRIEEKLAAAACARFGLDTSSVALDMTNFATFIDTANGRAPHRLLAGVQQRPDVGRGTQVPLGDHLRLAVHPAHLAQVPVRLPADHLLVQARHKFRSYVSSGAQSSTASTCHKGKQASRDPTRESEDHDHWKLGLGKPGCPQPYPPGRPVAGHLPAVRKALPLNT